MFSPAAVVVLAVAAAHHRMSEEIIVAVIRAARDASHAEITVAAVETAVAHVVSVRGA